MQNQGRNSGARSPKVECAVQLAGLVAQRCHHRPFPSLFHPHYVDFALRWTLPYAKCLSLCQMSDPEMTKSRGKNQLFFYIVFLGARKAFPAPPPPAAPAILLVRIESRVHSETRKGKRGPWLDYTEMEQILESQMQIYSISRRWGEFISYSNPQLHD